MNDIIGELPSYATGKLTEAELAEVRAKAREQVQAEQRKALMKEALDAALREERIAAGIIATPERPEEQLLEVTLDLPENVTPYAALVVDGRAYWTGQTYKLPKSLAMQLNSMQAEAWKNDSRQKGKVVDIHRKKPLAVGNGSVIGALPVAIGA
jgi:hypothetical protein